MKSEKPVSAVNRQSLVVQKEPRQLQLENDKSITGKMTEWAQNAYRGMKVYSNFHQGQPHH